MSTLTCKFAELSDTHPVPPDLVARLSSIRTHFSHASNGAITLDITTSRIGFPLFPGKELCYPFHLHKAVRELTNNPENSSRVNTVAVLYGSYYPSHRGVFGVMFDHGFVNDGMMVPIDDRSGYGPPREGCAIFLGAIQNARGLGEDFIRQTLFTTVHEIGHLFNLQHYDEEPNFMAQSSDETYKPHFFNFTKGQMDILSNHSDDRYIWPGGEPFGVTGPYSFYDAPTWLRKSKMSPKLEIEISMARQSFHYFEPVEMDIEVRLAAGQNSALAIPDHIDPGYEHFRIWIEEPTGERRRFRSPRIYCQNSAEISIKKDQSFLRDISIFGQSGGYTFRRSGVHKIWAEFAMPELGNIRSNTLEIEIRRFGRTDSDLERLWQTLTSRECAAVLYHRQDIHDGKGIKKLNALLKAGVGGEATASIAYALARTARNNKRSNKVAFKLLHNSLTEKTLGKNQQRLMEKLLV